MTTLIDTPPTSPWHEGERAVQTSFGVDRRMDVVGRHAIRDHLIDQHRAFYPLLPFVVLGAVDPAGDVWATVRAGHPGFLQAPDASHLDLEMGRDASDPADAGTDDGAAIALLGIELGTRRRNRLNGTVRRDTSERFAIEVGQSYGNCPQYIQLRSAITVRDPPGVAAIPPLASHALDARARAIVSAADTFFVATYVDRPEGRREVDVSHRGGRPGFVRIGEDGSFTIPDFAGNRFFNTLGNITANPRAGLVFVDFATGDLLQMKGSAGVILDHPEIAAFQGAERLWRFLPDTIVYRAGALPLRFTFSVEGWSPNALLTGTWAEAAVRLDAAKTAAADAHRSRRPQ